MMNGRMLAASARVRRGAVAVLLTLCCSGGCGSQSQRPYTDHSQDPSSFAADVKLMITDHVALAKRSREPADEMRIVLNFLEERNNRPQGSYADTYAKLYDLAKQIHAACETAGGKPAGLDKQLAELMQITESLPGTVDASIGKRESN